MKVLMLTQFAPYPPDYGAAKRIFHMLTETTKRHRVSLVSYGSEEEQRQCREHFGTKCDSILFVPKSKSRFVSRLKRLWFLITGRSSFRLQFSPRFQQAVDKLLAAEKFDLIHCSGPLLAYHRLPTDIPLVGDTHNVEYDIYYRTFRESRNIFRKLYYYREYKVSKRDEIENCSKFDVLLATSTRDMEIFKRDIPDKTMFVIPNGVDLKVFVPRDIEVEPNSMVFTGLMNYYPNDHGIIYFLDEIMPRILRKVPDAKIYVVGANPSRRLRDRKSGRVEITGYVEDVRPYMARAQVSVIPILIGGGTRLKALESMAMKKPIVTTSIGCEGINIRHGESALFADTPQQFADAVVQLFFDRDMREKLVRSAYRSVVDSYGWDTIGQRLEQVYEALRVNGSLQPHVSLNEVAAAG